MKLCILVMNSLKKDPRVIKQIRCARENGIDVFFIGYRDMHYDEKFLGSAGCKVSIIDPGSGKYGNSRFIFHRVRRWCAWFFRPVRQIMNIKPDVIHANDFDMLPIAYVAAKLCRCTVVYDSHEIYAENIGIVNKKLLKKLVVIIEGMLIKRVSAVISVSYAAAAYLQRIYGIPMPTVVTNCPYSSKASVINKAGKGFEVLYHGWMTKGRGYEEFVQSAKYLDKNIRLVIRGYGTIEGELRKIADSDGTRGIVEFHEPVEISDLVAKAALSDLAVVLTRPVNHNFEYSVSNKLFEYIHAGLPVIMSDLPEHRYLNAKYGFGIIIDDVDPVKIAEAINRLVCDKKLYGRLRQNAVRMSSEMCWENESKKLVGIYRKLA